MLASKAYIKMSLCAAVSLKQNVSRNRRNCPISTCDWCNSIGKPFHSRGPATEKLKSPRRVLVRRTIHVSTSADHSRRWPAFETSWQSSTKHCVHL